VTLTLDHLGRGAQRQMSRLAAAADFLIASQEPNGRIAWYDGGPWDAWNHAECLMALAVMGELEAARRGFDYLAETQDADGGWVCEYGGGLAMADEVRISRDPAPKFKDTNFAAYSAVGLWHLWRTRAETDDLMRYWPMVRSAIEFVLRLQHPEGDVSWSLEGHGGADDDALLAGNASIYKSLLCAEALSRLVGDEQPHWTLARARLRRAIACRPQRFDRAGRSRSKFAMDWYYPALSGALPPGAAFAKLEAGAARFVAPGVGCRCVDDHPWVTVAETCELALTMIGLGAPETGALLLRQLDRCRDEAGVYWMGWQYEAGVVWPQERPTWTQAAAILAHDALLGASPASDVLLPK
jgi:hypothetical protein